MAMVPSHWHHFFFFFFFNIGLKNATAFNAFFYFFFLLVLKFFAKKFYPARKKMKKRPMFTIAARVSDIRIVAGPFS